MVTAEARARISRWCRLFDIGLFLILLGAGLHSAEEDNWDCGTTWCYKLSNTPSNRSAANTTCSQQGASLADVTLETHWKGLLSLADNRNKTNKTDPGYSKTLWSNLVIERRDGIVEFLSPLGDRLNRSCETKACQDFLGSLTKDGVWCAVLNIGKTTTVSPEDCKVQHLFVCQKKFEGEGDYKIMGLNLELFAAFIVVLYLLVIFIISVLWGTYIENKKAEEYAVINREYFVASKKARKQEVAPFVAESQA